MEVLPVTRHKLKEFLSEEIALWRREGWIRSEAHEVLKGRYEVEPIGLSGVLRYTGIAGGSLMALGMTSSLSVLAGGSGGLGVMLALIAAAALGFGLKLTRRRRCRQSRFLPYWPLWPTGYLPARYPVRIRRQTA